MKTIYKNLTLGIFLALFAVVTASPSFAQDACANIEENQALYKKYTDNYAGTVAQVKVAIEAAKQYIEKYGACMDPKTNAPTYAEQVTYLKGALSEREEFVKKTEQGVADKAMYDKFNAAAKAKNVPEILASGKEILTKYPDSLDVMIIMTSAGFDEVIAKPTVTTYNDDVVTYAKKAIEQIEAGKPSKNYGALSYQLANKNNALGILNYSIGYTMLLDPAKKKEAAPYFYKATQHESNVKNNPVIYQAIGANYLDEILTLDKKRTDIIKAAGDKDTEESLAVEAMQKGYAERAIDAYARAYKSAKGDPKQKKEYVDSLSGRLKELYASRYTGKTLDNVDTYVTTVTSKSLTDPASKVEPVKEDPPATTPATTTTPDSNTTTKPATTPATTTTPKPATTTPTKPATTTPAKPGSSATTTTKPETTTDIETTATTKTKAKKPAPKKKGTR